MPAVQQIALGPSSFAFHSYIQVFSGPGFEDFLQVGYNTRISVDNNHSWCPASGGQKSLVPAIIHKSTGQKPILVPCLGGSEKLCSSNPWCPASGVQKSSVPRITNPSNTLYIYTYIYIYGNIFVVRAVELYLGSFMVHSVSVCMYLPL